MMMNQDQQQGNHLLRTSTTSTSGEEGRLPPQTAENIMENNTSRNEGIKSKILRRFSSGGKKSKNNNSKKKAAAAAEDTDDDTTIMSPISSSSSSSSDDDDDETFHIHTSLFDRPIEDSFFAPGSRRMPPPRLSRRKKHHGVSFTTSEAEVQRTISLEEYTPDEIAAVWFTSRDYMEFRKSCAKQVTKMEAGEKLRDVKYCSLGLERQTRLGYMTRKTTRLEAYDAVLSLQEDILRRKQRSWEEAAIEGEQQQQQQQDDYESCHDDDDNDHSYDDDDVEKIAFAYKQITSSCQLWATTVGMQIARDAEDIDDILHENTTKKGGDGGGDDFDFDLDDSHRSRAHLRELNNRALKCRESKRLNSYTMGKEPGCLSPRKVNAKGIPRNLFSKKFMNTTRGTASGSMLLL